MGTIIFNLSGIVGSLVCTRIASKFYFRLSVSAACTALMAISRSCSRANRTAAKVSHRRSVRDFGSRRRCAAARNSGVDAVSLTEALRRCDRIADDSCSASYRRTGEMRR
jgi:hypothetical protein